MKDYERRYFIERANDLAQELLSRPENELKKADAGVLADALTSFRDGIHEGRALTKLGHMARAIIATYSMRNGGRLPDARNTRCRPNRQRTFVTGTEVACR